MNIGDKVTAKCAGNYNQGFLSERTMQAKEIATILDFVGSAVKLLADSDGKILCRDISFLTVVSEAPKVEQYQIF